MTLYIIGKISRLHHNLDRSKRHTRLLWCKIALIFLLEALLSTCGYWLLWSISNWRVLAIF